jgi:hypothetical protein
MTGFPFFLVWRELYRLLLAAHAVQVATVGLHQPLGRRGDASRQLAPLSLQSTSTQPGGQLEILILVSNQHSAQNFLFVCFLIYLIFFVTFLGL